MRCPIEKDMLKFVSIAIDKFFELASLTNNISTNGFISTLQLLQILPILEAIGINHVADLETHCITEKLIQLQDILGYLFLLLFFLFLQIGRLNG